MHRESRRRWTSFLVVLIFTVRIAMCGGRSMQFVIGGWRVVGISARLEGVVTSRVRQLRVSGGKQAVRDVRGDLRGSEVGAELRKHAKKAVDLEAGAGTEGAVDVAGAVGEGGAPFNAARVAIEGFDYIQKAVIQHVDTSRGCVFLLLSVPRGSNGWFLPRHGK